MMRSIVLTFLVGCCIGRPSGWCETPPEVENVTNSLWQEAKFAEEANELEDAEALYSQILLQCGGDTCRFHKVNVYQRAIKTTRYVACAEHIGIFCDTVPAGQQDITEYLYEDSNTIEGRCENYVTKLPGAPGCLCQES